MNVDNLLTLATFSPCMQYRYTLPRVADPNTADRLCLFVMLNPSVADDQRNDPTVTRTINYAAAWGYDGLLVGNAYAYRSTSPHVLKALKDPIGPDNDAWLVVMAKLCEIAVIAWGTNCDPKRAGAVRDLITQAGCPLHYLRLTTRGEPWHPLYLPKDLKPLPWESRKRYPS